MNEPFLFSAAAAEIVLAVPTLSGPSEALVKTSITLECALPVYPWNQTVLLQLFKWVFVYLGRTRERCNQRASPPGRETATRCWGNTPSWMETLRPSPFLSNPTMRATWSVWRERRATQT